MDTDQLAWTADTGNPYREEAFLVLGKNNPFAALQHAENPYRTIASEVLRSADESEVRRILGTIAKETLAPSALAGGLAFMAGKEVGMNDREAGVLAIIIFTMNTIGKVMMVGLKDLAEKAEAAESSLKKLETMREATAAAPTQRTVQA